MFILHACLSSANKLVPDVYGIFSGNSFGVLGHRGRQIHVCVQLHSGPCKFV